MRIIQYIGVILFFFLVSCEKNDVEPQKTRTLMVYLAGDNNLSGHMQKNISSMYLLHKMDQTPKVELNQLLLKFLILTVQHRMEQDISKLVLTMQ